MSAVSNSVFAGGVWSPVSSFGYANDALGRRTERRDELAGVAAVATNLFAYNARSEVESAQMRHDTYGYGYDEIGNRLWSSNQWSGVDYTANQLNQYEDYYDESWRGQFAYDADGNMVAKDNDWWFQEWDAENRLTAAGYEYEEGYEEGGQWIVTWYDARRVEYQYDHLSRRVGKTVLSRFDDPEAPWTTNAVYRYVFDGWNLVAEHIQTPALPNTHTNHYVWGLDVSGSLQGAGGVGGLVAAFPDAPSANTQFLHEPLGIDRKPDPVAWAAQYGTSYTGTRTTYDGWRVSGVRFSDGGVQLHREYGERTVRSPAVSNGVGVVHFRARSAMSLAETHGIAIETATAASGPWATVGSVTVPGNAALHAFHVPVGDMRPVLFVRFRRTTGSSDERNYLTVRDIAFSRYSEVSLALFPAYDANGNVTELVDANGVRQARYEYDPFGQVASIDGPKAWTFPFRFSTKYHDDDTGCYYYGYRWYDPWSGRWLSRDPIEEEGGLNLYGFVGNDGAGSFDMVGLWRVAEGAYANHVKQMTDNARKVYRKESGDSLQGLAEAVGLDASSMEHWARFSEGHTASSTGTLLNSGAWEQYCYVSVPNVWIDADLLRGGGLYDRFVNLGGTLGSFVGTDIFTSGYRKVVSVESIRELIDAMRTHKGNVWGMSVFGHGTYGGVELCMPGMTKQAWTTGQNVMWMYQGDLLAQVDQNAYRLARVYMMQCYSACVGRVTVSGVTMAFDWRSEWEKRAIAFFGYQGMNALMVDAGWGVWPWNWF